MSAEGHQITFGFTTYDSDHWPPESRQASADNPDWAYEHLRQVMERAGLEHIAQHPDVYYPHLV